MKRNIKGKAYLSIVSIIFMSALLPNADAQQRVGSDLLDMVNRCRADRDDRRRLACYDAAASALATARDEHGLIALSQEQLREREQAGFGLNSNRPARTSAAMMPEPLDILESTVARVSQAGRDLYVLTLADKSVWRTTEPGRREPMTGDSVRIKRGALGSYLGSFAGARSVRIERLR